MLKVKGPTPDLDGAFAAMKREDAEALVVLESPVGEYTARRSPNLPALRCLSAAAQDRQPSRRLQQPSRRSSDSLPNLGSSCLGCSALAASTVGKSSTRQQSAPSGSIFFYATGLTTYRPCAPAGKSGCSKRERDATTRSVYVCVAIISSLWTTSSWPGHRSG